MFEAFDTFTTLFFIVFFLIFGFIIFTWVMSFARALRSRKEAPNQPAAQNESVITQREIIREVVKIRCAYCHGLYDETLNVCPHCGAKN